MHSSSQALKALRSFVAVLALAHASWAMAIDDATVERIHDQALTIDAHIDLPEPSRHPRRRHRRM
jgi:hypothetical protein